MTESNIILDHWVRPVHRGRPERADLHGFSANGACGDEVTMYLLLQGGTVADAYFEGEGCVICLGMASLLVEWLAGHSLDEVEHLTEAETLQMACGVEIDPRRRGCALMAYHALREALTHS
jgi:nitrogen fixation NifU-like protein